MKEGWQEELNRKRDVCEKGNSVLEGGYEDL